MNTQIDNTLDSRQFDLNYEDVLEDWSMAHAVREIIANALDERVLTGTTEPEITKDEAGAWHVRDFGRGLRYEHLTQNESKEKQQHPEMIGKFGIGLKDALATADRHNVSVLARSKHSDITIGRTNKHDFSDIVTLHANIAQPSDPNMTGTDFVLTGVTDQDISDAKDFFAQYHGEKLIEKTKYGVTLAKSGARARIYVNGLCVAEEPNFLFSYNITSLTTKLRAALNRERTNVGRTAYTDRVKAILLECRSEDVKSALADDLELYSLDKMHDELDWQEISQYATRILSAKEKVIWVTPSQLMASGSLISNAQLDGFRVMTTSDNVAEKLPSTDIDDRPMTNIVQYAEIYNRSFEYKFVEPEAFTPQEQAIWALTKPILGLVQSEQMRNVKQVLISETMRPKAYGTDDTLGVWEADKGRIIVKRSQLATTKQYAGTLLHESVHAVTGCDDLTFEFEQGLTELLGLIGARVVATVTSTN